MTLHRRGLFVTVLSAQSIVSGLDVEVSHVFTPGRDPTKITRYGIHEIFFSTGGYTLLREGKK